MSLTSWQERIQQRQTPSETSTETLTLSRSLLPEFSSSISFRCYTLPLTFFSAQRSTALNSSTSVTFNFSLFTTDSTTDLSTAWQIHWRQSFFCLLLDHFPTSIFQIFIFKFPSVRQNAKQVGWFQIFSQMCHIFLCERRHNIFVRQIQHLHYISSAQSYFVGVHETEQL